MSTPAASGPTYDMETVRLAYEQEVENLREAKRLQWQLTYLAIVALAAMAGAYQLLRAWNPVAANNAVYLFTLLGGGTALTICGFLVRTTKAMGGYRGALEDIAGALEDMAHPYVKDLLRIPLNYRRQRDPEPVLQIVAVLVGAGILVWMLLTSRTPAVPSPVNPIPSAVSPATVYETWWPVSPQVAVAILGTLVAAIALGKQYRDERNRRRAVDGRISAQAYAARRTIQYGWLEHPLRAPTGIVVGQGEINAGTDIAAEFGAVELRFESMAADGPDASKGVGEGVRRAVVLFYKATRRIQSELYRFKLFGGAKDPAPFVAAFGEFEECAKTLTSVIDPNLQDK